MSQPTPPSALEASIAEAVRIKMLENDLATVSSLLETARHKNAIFEVQVERKDAEIERMISEKDRMSKALDAARRQPNRSGSSGNQMDSAEFKELQAKMVEMQNEITMLRERNEMVEKRISRFRSEVEQYKNAVTSRTSRHTSIERKMLDWTRKYAEKMEGLANLMEGDDSSLTYESKLYDSIQDGLNLESASAKPRPTTSKLNTASQEAHESATSKDTAKPTVAEEQGFITPMKGKTVPNVQGVSKVLLEVQNASNNPYDLLADKDMVTETSAPITPLYQQALLAQSRGKLNKASETGGAGSKATSGKSSETSKQLSSPKPHQAKQLQDPSYSPASTPTPKVAKTPSVTSPSSPAPTQRMSATAKHSEVRSASTAAPNLPAGLPTPEAPKIMKPAPTSSQPTTPQMSATAKGKQPETRSAPTSVEKTPKTADAVLATPRLEAILSPLHLALLMAPPDLEAEKRAAIRVANYKLLKARGMLAPASPRHADKSSGVAGSSGLEAVRRQKEKLKDENEGLQDKIQSLNLV